MYKFLSWLVVFSVCFLKVQADIIYAGCDTSNLSVIDTTSNTVIATIETPEPTSQLALTPDHQFLYIATGSDSVYVVATANNSVIATIDGFTQATSIVANDTFAYVADTGTAVLSVIDISSNTVIDAFPETGGYSKMGITPNGGQVYAFTTSLTQVIVIDTQNNTVVATIDTATSDRINSFTAGQKAFLVSLNGNIYVIDTLTNDVIATPMLSQSRWAAITSQGLVYVAGASTVNVIDDSNNLIASIEVAEGANFVTSSPDGKFVYVTAYGSISVIDTASQEVVANIETESSVSWMVCSPDSKFLYATLADTGTVAVIDANTNAILTRIPVQDSPSQLVYLSSSANSLDSDPQPMPEPDSISALAPAFNLSGRQVKHTFFTQKNRINIINWTVPSDFTPVMYQLYRDSAHTELAGSVPADQLEFQDHHRVKKQMYTYYLVAVDRDGNIRNMGAICVASIS